MIRALTALLGFAAAAVLLEVAPRAGHTSGSSFWWVALLWAAAGLVAGALYQAGGIRAPGLRVNPWLFLLCFVPWTLLAAGVVVQRADTHSWYARLARTIFPDSWLVHWSLGTAAFAFGAGLLLALSVVEPLVGDVVEAAPRERAAPEGVRDGRTEPVVTSRDPVVQDRAPEPVTTSTDQTAVDQRPAETAQTTEQRS
jgi:uncharacterized membrane protein YhaH (DUF805 family)